MRTIATVIAALGLAAGLAAAAPANAEVYDGGHQYRRAQVEQVSEWHGHHKWYPVHYSYRHHDHGHHHAWRYGFYR